MAKGFLAGVISGGFVSAIGLAVVSPMLPSVEMGVVPAAPVEAPAPMTETVPDPAVDGTQVAPPAAETDSAPISDVADVPEQAEQPADGQADPTTEVADETDTGEPNAPDQPAMPDDEDAVTPDAPAPAPAPEVTIDQQSGLGTSVGPIDDQATGVTTNRLPSIGAADPEPEAQVADDAAPSPDADARLVDLSTSPLAIERNSVPVSDTQGRPLMAVVLKDMGPERTQLQGFDKLPFTLSVILDVNAPDLDEAMAFYRDAGAELVIQADLPPSASPTDAEVNLQVQQPKLDKGVAVYMPPESGFQSNAPLSRQIAEILVASGHGLISEPSGLNTGHKNALKTGVPSGLIFRELDGDGQDNKVIRRFLDNAAFKADLEEGVILMGHAVPQTLTALVEWSVGNRISSVAMVPVSAVLLGGS